MVRPGQLRFLLSDIRRLHPRSFVVGSLLSVVGVLLAMGAGRVPSALEKQGAAALEEEEEEEGHRGAKQAPHPCGPSAAALLRDFRGGRGGPCMSMRGGLSGGCIRTDVRRLSRRCI